MKEYKQSEWMEIVNKSRGGRISVYGVNLAKDLTIESLSTTTALSATLESWGKIFADNIKEIDGRKQFSFTADGISLVVDADKDIRFKPVAPKGIENPKTIPFSKWVADYIKWNNAVSRREEDKIHRLSIVGCEINHEGIVSALNAEVTWEKVYGSFNRLTTETQLEITRDILGWTYGMNRHDNIYDDWTPNCCGDHGYRAYFTDGFDIVYADDGRYDIMDYKQLRPKVA